MFFGWVRLSSMMFMGTIIAIMTQMNWIANFHVARSQGKMTVDSAGIDLRCATVLCDNDHSLFVYNLLEKNINNDNHVCISSVCKIDSQHIRSLFLTSR